MIKTILYTLQTMLTAILLGVYNPEGSEYMVVALAGAYVFYLYTRMEE